MTRAEDEGDDDAVRAYVSQLWSDDWESPEDAVYDEDEPV